VSDFVRLTTMTMLLLLAAISASRVSAEETESKKRNRFEVRPATSKIHVDGVLDEPAWADALVIPLTYEWLPGDNTPPPVKTDCLVTFDSQNLYVAFRAFDPHPSEIRAHLSDRDSALNDDTVGFYIDTFNDQRRAYEFRVNPLGVQLDATVSDVDDSEDFSYDAIWDSAGRITPDGYVVEIALPLKQIRFPRSADVQTWGFLASRDYPRSLDHQIRSTYNERRLNCRVCQFDSLTGFHAIRAGYNLELDPTLTASRSDARPTLADPLENGSVKTKAGLSVRWGITPNVSLNAAVDPDFSQVEADAAQLNVNERFALFFPEKRPFFLEGADYFSTPFQAVFSRTVADPSGGLKVTGKEGRDVFGVSLAQDRINNLIFPANQSSGSTTIDESVQSEVLRYRRDIGASSTLGVLYTGRDGDSYFNHVYGADGSLRVSRSDTVRFQFLDSRTEYPDAVALANGQHLGVFGGNAYRLDYLHATRDWIWTATYQSLNPNFRADSGFIPQVDIHGYNGTFQRTIWGGPGDWYNQLQIFTADQVLRDHTGNISYSHADLVLVYLGPLQSDVELGFRPNYKETFNGARFRDFRQDLTSSFRPTGDLGLGLYVRHGDNIDFVNTRQVQFLLLRPSGDFRIGAHVQGQFQDDWQVFTFKGHEFLRANLAQGTFFYHWNVKTFFRAIVQYRTVSRNLDLYNNPSAVLPKEKSLFTQFLFSYKLSPQTVFLLGYSDNFQATDQIDLTQQNRAFFVKVGYAWLR